MPATACRPPTPRSRNPGPDVPRFLAAIDPAAAFDELFTPVAQTFPPLFDPLAAIVVQPPLGVWLGGNPTLKPEKTDAYSAGIVWNPAFIPGFTLTVDWYQLFTRDVILGGNDFAQLALTQNTNSGGRLFVDPDGCGGGGGAVQFFGGPGVGITSMGKGTWNVSILSSPTPGSVSCRASK